MDTPSSGCNFCELHVLWTTGAGSFTSEITYCLNGICGVDNVHLFAFFPRMPAHRLSSCVVRLEVWVAKSSSVSVWVASATLLFGVPASRPHRLTLTVPIPLDVPPTSPAPCRPPPPPHPHRDPERPPPVHWRGVAGTVAVAALWPRRWPAAPPPRTLPGNHHGSPPIIGI
eukprot:EG_transcript_6129